MAPQVLIKKIKISLDEDVKNFIKIVSDTILELDDLCYIDLHGLNVSIYIHRGESDIDNKPVYDAYSFDYSENLGYYDEIWRKYSNEIQRFSKFDKDIDEQRGWYESVIELVEKPLNGKNNTHLKDFDKKPLPKEKRLSSSVPEHFKKVYPKEFIYVKDGWEKFIENLPEKEFNLSWTSCFKHTPPVKFEYKDWFISCYLLLNIGNLIREKNVYESAIRPNLNKLLFNISLLLHEELVNSTQEDLLREATKAAISQVMARNMSHNIGSHVLSRMITAESMTIEKLLNKEPQYNPLFIKKNTPKYEEEIAFFNSYLKTRMDYLADIATSTPSMQNTKLFKGEVLSGFDKNRILLNRISGIQNFEYEIKIVFKDENDVEIISPKQDFSVAISNDVMGQHAFYIILENIIRNTAKHGSIRTDISAESNCRKPKSKVQFTIQIKECETDSSYYEVKIYDDCIISGKLFSISELDSKKYKDLFEDIYTEIPGLKKLVFDQNYRLNESVLNEKTMALRHGAWGLIEMDVSAAYLRKIPIENVDTDKYQIPLNKKQVCNFKLDSGKEKLRILEAVIVTTESAQHLGYKFYLPKPQEVLIIDYKGDTWDELFRNDDGAIDENFLRILTKQGILFLTIKQNSGEWLYKPNETDYSHEILLVINGKNRNELKKSHLPFKMLTKDEFYEFYNHYYGLALSSLKECLSETKKFIIDLHRALLYKKMYIEKIKKFLSTSLPTVRVDNTNPKYCYKPLEIEEGNEFKLELSDHGEGVVNTVLNEIRQDGTPVIFHHFEAYGSVVKSIVEKSQPNNNLGALNLNFDEKTTISFLWSALVNVIILDERIQEQAEKGTYKPEGEKEVALRKLFDKMNIIVPSSEENGFDLSAHSYPYKESYIKYISGLIDSAIKNNSNRIIKNVDFIVIHLGVIEKIRKAQNLPKEKTDIQEFKSELEKIYPESRIIVTSGRGKPDNLPDDITFLGYSILSQYVLESRLKYLLVNALNSSRPQSKNI